MTAGFAPRSAVSGGSDDPAEDDPAKDDPSDAAPADQPPEDEDEPPAAETAFALAFSAAS